MLVVKNRRDSMTEVSTSDSRVSEFRCSPKDVSDLPLDNKEKD